MTEKEIRQEAEERYLFPSVEYDDYNSVSAFVEGAEFIIDKVEKWLEEHLANDTSVLCSGVVHISFNTLMDNFRKEYGIKTEE